MKLTNPSIADSAGGWGRSTASPPRMTLSYDFTFLGTLMMALAENRPEYEKRRCPANPLKQCIMAELDDVQSYCADCAMLILYYKIQDDIHDRDFPAAAGLFCSLLPAAMPTKRPPINCRRWTE